MKTFYIYSCTTSKTDRLKRKKDKNSKCVSRYAEIIQTKYACFTEVLSQWNCIFSLRYVKTQECVLDNNSSPYSMSLQMKYKVQL